MPPRCRQEDRDENTFICGFAMGEDVAKSVGVLSSNRPCGLDDVNLACHHIAVECSNFEKSAQQELAFSNFNGASHTACARFEGCSLHRSYHSHS